MIERKLVEENVPYEIYGGTKFYQRMEILDIVAYLRMIAYGDDLSFKRIVNTLRRKFSIDGVYNKGSFGTREQALAAIFNKLEKS